MMFHAKSQKCAARAHWIACGLALLALFFDTAPVRSQEPPVAAEAPAADADPSRGGELSIRQAQLADRFERLEIVVGRLAELSASTDPRRARLLREAIAQSREQDINVRFESIVKLLEDERLSAAGTNQTELQKELEGLLTLLLKADRDRELASQRERVRKYLKELSRLIRMQKGIRARTEGGDELRGLGEDQQRVASDTGKLGGEIAETEGTKESGGNEAEASEPGDTQSGKSGEDSKPGESESGKPSEGEPSESQPGEGQPSEGKPSDGKSSKGAPSQSQGQPGSPGESGQSGEKQNESQDPTERATDRLRRAQQQMDEARKKLEEAEREGAAERQREALQELEQAKAELERVLRQLREEELERTLTQLAARFRKMLEWQNAVYEGTVRLDRVPQDQRDHDEEIEAARLSRQESQIVHEADKALLLLREDGSSVAFPEAVEQMRDDMQQVAERLSAVKVDAITQGIEQDVIAALEELIAALEKAIEDLEKKRSSGGQMPGASQPSEPELVDKLAELKMIRSLQMRIYQRTQRYGQMIEGEQAETAELLEALQDLAQRQQRVHRATADLQQGRND